MELEPDFDNGADAWANVPVWSATAAGGAVTLEADATDAEAVPGAEPPLSVLPGPIDVAETFMWPREYWRSLKVVGEQQLGIDLAWTLRVALEEGLNLSTEHSGMGCPEASLEMTIRAGNAIFQKDMFARVASGRAGDVLARCRAVLMRQEGPLTPSCVFGNILDRCNKHELGTARNLRLRYKFQLATRSQPNHVKQKALKRMYGEKYFSKLVALLINEVPPDHQSTAQAYCHKHGGECPLYAWPPRSSSLPRRRRTIIAGSIATTGPELASPKGG